MPSREFYDKVYPANYKQPRQLIHMQRKNYTKCRISSSQTTSLVKEKNKN